MKLTTPLVSLVLSVALLPAAGALSQAPPEANEDESKAWYFTHRLLGDVYVDEKPDQAVLCYLEFRNSDEAGADTSG